MFEVVRAGKDGRQLKRRFRIAILVMFFVDLGCIFILAVILLALSLLSDPKGPPFGIPYVLWALSTIVVICVSRFLKKRLVVASGLMSIHEMDWYSYGGRLREQWPDSWLEGERRDRGCTPDKRPSE